ncbi:DDE superfamily endonuclease [Popillia japonica]|uniref:DDE superfamily endonuclease n=1 Tax=Popillia japonica TaxID=7064 RepID=A0AAW1IC31_POPJA
MTNELKTGAPPRAVVTLSDTGYINADIFLEWLKHFIRNVKRSNENKVLLLLDGHTTHSKNLDAILIARENGIILLQLPGHTTHRLQPLDLDEKLNTDIDPRGLAHCGVKYVVSIDRKFINANTSAFRNYSHS